MWSMLNPETKDVTFLILNIYWMWMETKVILVLVYKDHCFAYKRDTVNDRVPKTLST